MLTHVVTHFLDDKSCHSLVKHDDTHFLPFEVDANVSGFDVHIGTQLSEVSSAKFGSTQVVEHELLFGFLYKPAAQSDTQVLFAEFETNPVEHDVSQNDVKGSA